MALLRVDVEDGKYTVIFLDDGGVSAMRNGQFWRNLNGDNLVLALAQELDKARHDRTALLAACEGALLAFRSEAPEGNDAIAALESAIQQANSK